MTMLYAECKDKLIGKVIKSVDFENYNSHITFHFTDGTWVKIESDMGHESLEMYSNIEWVES